MKWLYRKNLEKSTLITSPQIVPSSRARNMYDTRLAVYALFSTAGSEFEINIVMPGVLQIDAVGVGGHNFSEGSTLSVNGGGALPMSQVHALVDVGDITAQNFKVIINDPSIQLGETRYIGRLEIGLTYSFPGISYNVKLDEVSNSETILSASRQAYGYRRVTYTRGSVQFPMITREQMEEMTNIFKYLDTFTPFFTHFDEDCIEGKTNYGILEDTKTLSFQMNEAQVYTTSLSISEVN